MKTVIQEDAVESKINRTVSEFKTEGTLKESQLRPFKYFISKESHSYKTAEELSNIWHIRKAQDEWTLFATTMRLISSSLIPLVRRYCVVKMFITTRIICTVEIDTMDARVKFIHENRYWKVFWVNSSSSLRTQSQRGVIATNHQSSSSGILDPHI